MAITDPRAVQFSNEVVRPLSERLRQLKEDIERAKLRWTDEVAALVPNDAAQALDDGREAQGVSRLDGAEINAIAADLNAYATWFDARTGMESRLAKASVRTLRVP